MAYSLGISNIWCQVLTKEKNSISLIYKILFVYIIAVLIPMYVTDLQYKNVLLYFV